MYFNYNPFLIRSYKTDSPPILKKEVNPAEKKIINPTNFYQQILQKAWQKKKTLAWYKAQMRSMGRFAYLPTKLGPSFGVDQLPWNFRIIGDNLNSSTQFRRGLYTHYKDSY